MAEMEASLSDAAHSVCANKINKGIREEVLIYNTNIISGDCKRRGQNIC